MDTVHHRNYDHWNYSSRVHLLVRGTRGTIEGLEAMRMCRSCKDSLGEVVDVEVSLAQVESGP